MPELCPARRDPAVLVRTRPHEVTLRVQARGPQVGPVRVRPLHRVTQDRDQLGRRDQLPDPALCLPVIQVERGRLAAQQARGGRPEQRLVVGAAPDVLTPGGDVTRPAPPAGRRPVGQEELRLLDRGHVQRRVPVERGVQGGRPRLGGTDDQEVGQRHGQHPSIKVRLGTKRHQRGSGKNYPDQLCRLLDPAGLVNASGQAAPRHRRDPGHLARRPPAPLRGERTAAVFPPARRSHPAGHIDMWPGGALGFVV
jgi:hypothetical protein